MENASIPCTWLLETGDSTWQTACRDYTHSFEFNDGGPVENGFRFCPYCGCTLKERMVEDEDAD